MNDEFIQTGNYILDAVLEGGIPQGRLNMVVGSPQRSAMKIANMSLYGTIGTNPNPCRELILHNEQTADEITRRARAVMHELLHAREHQRQIHIERNNDAIDALMYAFIADSWCDVFDTKQGIKFKKPKPFKP